jgi:hypothetical protein
VLSIQVAVEMPKGKKEDDCEIDDNALKHVQLLFNNEAIVRELQHAHVGGQCQLVLLHSLSVGVMIDCSCNIVAHACEY